MSKKDNQSLRGQTLRRKSTSHGITLSRHDVLDASHTRRASPLLAGLSTGITPSSGNSITRQGISLYVLFGLVRTEQHFLCMPFPACRHAEGTISSSSVLDVWRMASEDSDQIVPGFSPIHRFGDLSYLD